MFGGELRAVEGQKARHADLAFQPVLHIGVDDIDLFEFARVVRVQKDVRDLPRALNGGVLRRVEKAPADGNIVPLVVLPPVFAHHEQFLFSALLIEHFLRRLDDVLVVRTRKPFIRRHDEAANRAAVGKFAFERIKVAVLHALVRAENALDLRLYGVEVGARPVQPLFGFAHLRGGDQIHCLRDLLRIEHALDVRFDLFDAGHQAVAPSRFQSARYSSERRQMRSRSSGVILPVCPMRSHRSAAWT